MSTRSFYIAIFFIIASIRLFIVPIQVGDLAVWVADGLQAIELGKFLIVDTFSIHENLGFDYPSRLSNVIFGYLFNKFGYISVVAFLRLNILLVFLYLYLKFIIDKITFNPFNLLLLLISVIGISFPMDRPQILIALLALLAFENILKSKSTLIEYYQYFFICIFWINLHPSLFILFPIALWKVLISTFQKRDSLRHDLYILAMTSIATIMTVSGVKIFKYVYDTIRISKLREISEWQSIISLDYPYFSILYLLGIIILILVIYKKKKLKEFIYHPFFPVVFMGLGSIRNIFWFFLLLIPVITGLKLWSSTPNKFFISRKKNLFTVIFITLFILIFTFYSKLRDGNNLGFSIDAPVLATKKINQIKGPLRIFNQWELGSYLILNQKNKIFIDTRNIIYSEKIFNDYKSILNGNIELLDRYQVNAVILRNENYPLVKLLSGWRKEFTDKNFVLFLKDR